MLIAVTGATGVVGRRAVAALVGAGHEVRALSRSDQGDRLLRATGASPVRASLFDPDALARVFEDCDAVAGLATHVPVGLAGVWPGAWRSDTRIRTVGVRAVVRAAERAGVRRMVQLSASLVYADRGEEWIDEDSPLDISGTIEPVAVAEAAVQDFADAHRAGVVLRLGTIVGADPMTRWRLEMVRRGRAVGLGTPEGWTHLVHTDDLGGAVVAAVQAPSGVYNVGAEPVCRRDLDAALAHAVGVEPTGFLGPVARRLAGARSEALGRSHRVCGDRFTAQTGWVPRRRRFDAGWLRESAERDQLAGAG